MTARRRPAFPAALLAVGILSLGCSAVSGPPRSPGSPGGDIPVGRTDGSPFSIEEHERIASFDPWVTQAAKRHGLDPDLIRGVIWVESRYDHRAKSPAGARGLMQLMPQTAAGLAQKMGASRANPYDPEFNVSAGTLYLSNMIARYGGDVGLGLSAYNAGPGNVDRWRAQGMPPRNREYVQLVLDAKARFEAAYHTPQSRAVDTQIAHAQAKDARPPIEIPEPPPPATHTDDGIPVRWDLDRVESDHQPVAEDPPMGETPPPGRAGRSGSEPERAPADGTDEQPTFGVGVLPSVIP